MKMSPNLFGIIIATIVLGIGAYWLLFVNTGNNPPLTTSATASADQAKFESLVSEIRPISFNTGVFNDPRFQSLVDLTTSITPEPIGRPDPFAPLPGQQTTGQ